MKPILSTILLTATTIVPVALVVMTRDSTAKAQPTPMSDSALTLFAWKTLARLLPDQNAPWPQWETWHTKCELHLEPCLTNTPTFQQPLKVAGQISNGMKSTFDAIDAASATEGLFLLRNDVRLPRQLVFAHGLDRAVRPQFASVLFNDRASQSIKIAEGNLSRKEAVHFRPGSIIVKVVWDMISLRSDKSDPATPLFATTVGAAPDEQSAAEAQFAPPPPESQHWIPYSIDLRQTKQLSGCRPEPRAVLPLDCIHQYHFSVRPNSPGAQIVAAMRNEPVRSNFQAVWSACALDDCMLAMVGIHIMVRLDDNDALAQRGRYPWVFMTFWWTGTSNHTRLPSPWSQYQLNVTQAPRNDNVSDYHNICFNPYLESVLPNGAVSNCINCHRFAGWNPNVNHASPAILGSLLGSMPLYQRPPARSVERYGSEFRSTDLVWSLASYQSAAAPLRPQPNTRPH